jgi:hypothetical protein
MDLYLGNRRLVLDSEGSEEPLIQRFNRRSSRY